MKKQTAEIAEETPCPCGKGKTYGECCKQQGVTYYTDAEGDLSKSIPMNEELVAVFEQLKEEFEEAFQRPPEGQDRVFFSQHLHSPEDQEKETVEAMLQAGIREELIYCYLKTDGLLLTEDNEHLVDQTDLDEYQAAYEEYFELSEKGLDPFKCLENNGQSDRENELISLIRRSCYWATLHTGSMITDHEDKIYDDLVSIFQMNLLVRIVDVQRNIYWMLENRYSDTVFFSIRFLYESYLRLRSVRINASLAESFLAFNGISVGTHSIISKKRIRKIFDKEREQEFDFPPTNRAMSSLNDDGNLLSDFHDHFYGFVSNWSHPSFDLDLIGFQSNAGFKSHRPKNRFEGAMWAAVINTLLATEISKIQWATEQRSEDFSRLASRIRQFLLELADCGASAEKQSPLLRATLRLLQERGFN